MLSMGSLNINAKSVIEGKDVAYFNASFSNNTTGNFSFSENVSDAKTYKEHEAECEADYEEFKQKAMDYVRDNQLDAE